MLIALIVVQLGHHYSLRKQLPLHFSYFYVAERSVDHFPRPSSYVSIFSFIFSSKSQKATVISEMHADASFRIREFTRYSIDNYTSIRTYLVFPVITIAPLFAREFYLRSRIQIRFNGVCVELNCDRASSLALVKWIDVCHLLQ